MRFRVTVSFIPPGVVCVGCMISVIVGFIIVMPRNGSVSLLIRNRVLRCVSVSLVVSEWGWA